jgi:microcystin-dependent protein
VPALPDPPLNENVIQPPLSESDWDEFQRSKNWKFTSPWLKWFEYLFSSVTGAVQGSGLALLESGDIIPTGRSTARTGFLMCDGTAYQTSQFPALFSAIGYTYGGAGASFNVPDLRNVSPMGAGATVALGASAGASSVNVPHDHSVSSHSHGVGTLGMGGPDSTDQADYAAGAFTFEGASILHVHILSGSTATGGGGTTGSTSPSVNVLHPVRGVNFMIKT